MTLRATVVALLVAALLPATVAAAPPRLQARSAILVEASTGDVAYSRNASSRRQVASTTKLMTALLTLERAELDETFTAPGYTGLAVESAIGLRAGERLTVRDLLRALLVGSANDAAAALAQGVSGSTSRFVAAMNRRARQLRLRNTRFANPIGLDQQDNHSTAADLVTLTRHLRRFAFFRATVDMPRATLRSGAHPRTVVNRNRLVRRVPWVDGVKTGHTLGAGYVLIGSGTMDGVTMISAVLGEPSEARRERDTLALLRWGARRYERLEPVHRGRTVAKVPVRYRDEDVDLVAGRSVERIVRKGERIAVRVDAPEELEGPLPRGRRVGTAYLIHRGREFARVPLITAEAVPDAGLGRRLADYFTNATTILLVLAVGLCSLLLGMLRRRAHARRRPRQEVA